MSKFDVVSIYAILAGQGKEPADTDVIKDVIVGKSGRVAKIIFINGHAPQYVFMDKKLRLLFG